MQRTRRRKGLKTVSFLVKPLCEIPHHGTIAGGIVHHETASFVEDLVLFK